MLKQGHDTRELRMQYVAEIDDRIDRWREATRRLRSLAMSKPPELRQRIDMDIADAEGQLEHLRRKLEELRHAVGQGWHDTASAIGRGWDSFQAAYDSARSRL